MVSGSRVASAAGSERRVAARFNAPRAARVEANASGFPVEVNHQPVAVLREEWRVVDRWWTEDPVVRRHFELVPGAADVLDSVGHADELHRDLVALYLVEVAHHAPL